MSRHQMTQALESLTAAGVMEGVRQDQADGQLSSHGMELDARVG